MHYNCKRPSASLLLLCPELLRLRLWMRGNPYRGLPRRPQYSYTLESACSRARSFRDMARSAIETPEFPKMEPYEYLSLSDLAVGFEEVATIGALCWAGLSDVSLFIGASRSETGWSLGEADVWRATFSKSSSLKAPPTSCHVTTHPHQCVLISRFRRRTSSESNLSEFINSWM